MSSLPAAAEPRYVRQRRRKAGASTRWSGSPAAGSRSVVITAGFHGDEKAGPLTLLEHVSEIVEYAAARDVALAIYPVREPVRVSRRTPATTSRASGPTTTSFATKPRRAAGAASCATASGSCGSRRPATAIPKETVALARELDTRPPPQAALDLHQDNFIHGSLFYAYIFGDPASYRPMLARSGALVPVLRSSIVDSGHEPGTDVRADDGGLHRLPRRQRDRTASTAPASPTRPRSRRRPRPPGRWPTRST